MPPFSKLNTRPPQSLVIALPRGRKVVLRTLLAECDKLTAHRAEKLVLTANILLSNGFSLTHTAILLRVPPVTLMGYREKYRRGGFAALLKQPMGPKAKRRSKH